VWCFFYDSSHSNSKIEESQNHSSNSHIGAISKNTFYHKIDISESRFFNAEAWFSSFKKTHVWVKNHGEENCVLHLPKQHKHGKITFGSTRLAFAKPLPNAETNRALIEITVREIVQYIVTQFPLLHNKERHSIITWLPVEKKKATHQVTYLLSHPIVPPLTRFILFIIFIFCFLLWVQYFNQVSFLEIDFIFYFIFSFYCVCFK
jgi:hypothetical protein